jgi:hypothetical protein
MRRERIRKKGSQWLPFFIWRRRECADGEGEGLA